MTVLQKAGSLNFSQIILSFVQKRGEQAQTNEYIHDVG